MRLQTLIESYHLISLKPGYNPVMHTSPGECREEEQGHDKGERTRTVGGGGEGGGGDGDEGKDKPHAFYIHISVFVLLCFVFVFVLLSP